MSGAPPGVTLLNQPAYEEIVERYSAYCSFHETHVQIKHEGLVLAYAVRLNKRDYSPSLPAWRKLLGTANSGQ